jgi:hypothetical protein
VARKFHTIQNAILFNKTDPWTEDALPVLRRELIGITALLAIRAILDSVQAQRASYGQDCGGEGWASSGWPRACSPSRGVGAAPGASFAGCVRITSPRGSPLTNLADEQRERRQAFTGGNAFFTEAS